MKAGIYPGLPMAEYLAIPALSASIIKTTVERCPRAAWYESWLNPQRPRDDTDASDAGSIAHSILLEGTESCCEVFEPSDYPNLKGGGVATGWTNKAIQDARAASRAAGKIPVLAGDMNAIRAMVAEARSFIDSLRATESAIWQSFQAGGGQSEVVFVWQEGDTLCKLRTDRIATDHGVITDYKTSGMSVEPNRWARTQLTGLGLYVGAAWYRRGVRALTGVDPAYVFLCQEQDAPYLCSLPGVDPAGMELGDEKCGAGLREWQQCVRKKHWPAYPNRVCWAELPPWERMRWDERNGVDAHGIPYDISKLFERTDA